VPSSFSHCQVRQVSSIAHFGRASFCGRCDGRYIEAMQTQVSEVAKQSRACRCKLLRTSSWIARDRQQGQCGGTMITRSCELLPEARSRCVFALSYAIMHLKSERERAFAPRCISCVLRQLVFMYPVSGDGNESYRREPVLNSGPRWAQPFIPAHERLPSSRGARMVFLRHSRPSKAFALGCVAPRSRQAFNSR
jgi:hypothetical protein